ncbi:MAG: alpha-D-ribose 1-methylphosphonate 5-triphosphate diphosphatase [Nevskiaceae bacterium]|nr:alpha-D-ribose 1-methylphosphonate 5-triphosphate diphosphatase [Nevskiaceae bacterium]
MSSYYLVGARVVLANDVLNDASVLIEDDKIVAIDPVSSGRAQEISLKGQVLIPGVIDLHCDALEKEVEPRPNVRFPTDFAVAQADRRNASAGITTIFHAISFANEELGVRNNDFAASVARAVHQWNTHALIDNRVHCRYEVTDPTAPALLLELMDADQMHLLSVMDHSPGQGQFKDLAAFRDYLSRTYKHSEAELDALVEKKIAQGNGAMERIRLLIDAAKRKGIRIASHDDDTAEKVTTLHEMGVGISEFPINLAAASAAHSRGMSTIFGAPNILRGKSQSGSMRALDAIVAGVADCLCADYHPAALLSSVFRLPQLTDISLPAAVRLVSSNPAHAAGLEDRGEISVGKRADLVSVVELNGLAQASRVFSNGRPVFEAHFHG